MTFLRLHGICGEIVWVNADHITHVTVTALGRTMVDLGADAAVWVTETPDEIIDMALNGVTVMQDYSEADERAAAKLIEHRR